eukprot:m.127685 g.127685  ORF g.127685 m.127685 type:complete len:118 (+) comp23556_c0_seq7:159-512(+)
MRKLLASMWEKDAAKRPSLDELARPLRRRKLFGNFTSEKIHADVQPDSITALQGSMAQTPEDQGVIVGEIPQAQAPATSQQEQQAPVPRTHPPPQSPPTKSRHGKRSSNKTKSKSLK